VVDRNRVQLLFGPYKAPPLKRGDRAFCLVRDGPVVVLGWSEAPTPWPRCRALECPRAGHGLLIEDELARAVRHEAAAAVAYWWGVSRSAVRHWRKALGVTRTNNEGKHRLVLGAISATLKARFGAGPGRRGHSRSRTRYRAAIWTAEEIALVGALADAEVAQRTGRSTNAVLKKRNELGRPAVTARGVAYARRFWRAEEDEAVRTLPAQDAARATGRSLEAVYQRKKTLRRRGESTEKGSS
jgi:hypothetical protein